MTDAPSAQNQDQETLIFAGFQRGEIPANAMISALNPMLKRVSTAVANKISSRVKSASPHELRQDMYQEAVIALMTSVKSGFDAERGSISTYLYSSLKNNGFHAQEKDTYPLEEQFDDAGFVTYGHDAPYTPDFAGDADAAIAKRKLANAISMRKKNAESKQRTGDTPMTGQTNASGSPLLIDMSSTYDVHELPEYDENDAASEEGLTNAKPRALGPEHQELKDILNYLMLEHQEAADMLGLRKPTLASYLYGKTTSVPDLVLERARFLAKQPQLIHERDLYVENDMPAILSLFQEKAGVTSSAALAKILCVHEITVDRWQKGLRPSMSSFRQHYRRLFGLPQV